MPLNANGGPLDGKVGPLDTQGGAGTFGATVSGTITLVIGDFITAASGSISGGPSTHVVTATAGAHGSINPSGAVTVNDGDTTAFTFTALTGYHVSNVTVNGVSLGALANYTFSPILADQTIDVQFAINTYTITVSAGAGGSILPATNQAANYGDSVVFTITPSPGFNIANIVVGGVSVGSTSPVTVGPVTADTSIAVTFAAIGITYHVFAVPHAGGNMSPVGTVSVANGGTQSFTITPDAGYHISSILIDGVDVGTTSPRSVGPVSHDSTIDAFFTSDTPPATVAGSDDGPRGKRARSMQLDGQELVMGRDGVYRSAQEAQQPQRPQAKARPKAQPPSVTVSMPKPEQPVDHVGRALDAAKLQDAWLARFQSTKK